MNLRTIGTILIYWTAFWLLVSFALAVGNAYVGNSGWTLYYMFLAGINGAAGIGVYHVRKKIV